jgi:hypothetical protein
LQVDHLDAAVTLAAQSWPSCGTVKTPFGPAVSLDFDGPTKPSMRVFSKCDLMSKMSTDLFERSAR